MENFTIKIDTDDPSNLETPETSAPDGIPDWSEVSKMRMEDEPEITDATDWDDFEDFEWDDGEPTSKTPEEIEAERLAEQRRQGEAEFRRFKERALSQYDFIPDDYVDALAERFRTGELTYTAAYSVLREDFRADFDKKYLHGYVSGNHIPLSDDFMSAADSLIDRGLESNVITNVIGRGPRTESEILEYANFCLELRNNDTIIIESGEQRDTPKSEFLRSYFMTHGLDQKRIEGFRAFFEQMKTDDPEFKDLDKPNNAWGTSEGKFGINDFKIHGLVSEVTPRNIRDLIQINREIPTGDYHRFEQNRADACAIQNIIIAGRDFIHDERPGVHETLSAMLEYYDAKDDPAELAKKREALEEILARKTAEDGTYHGIADYALDLENYDKRIERTVRAGNGEAQEYNETAIDILRRMVENTSPDRLEIPETGDAKLNELMQRLDIVQNERTGETHVDWKQVGDLVQYLNETLSDRQGSIGLHPSEVQALAFSERMATYAMRDVDNKDWRELPYDPVFKELVKFRELTGSADKFNADDFETFWNRFTRLSAEPDDSELVEHYKMLQKRILTQVSKLAVDYTSTPGSEYLAASLYSGNLTHELMGLVDARPGATLRDHFHRITANLG